MEENDISDLAGVEGVHDDDPVRYWLLDAAISDYSSNAGFHFFKKKGKPRLSDLAFSDPGVTEYEMLAFLVQRGASQKCINYARSKFTEAHFTAGNSPGSSDSSIHRGIGSDITVSTGSEGTEPETSRSVWRLLTKPWRSLKKRKRTQPYIEI